MPRLTKRFVDALQADPMGKEVTHWDDVLKGFGLRVQPGGARSWVIMYRTQEGRLRKLSIGRVGALTPDEARREAKIKLGEVEKGGDPAGEKSAARKAMTVAELCDLYLVEAAKSPGPRGKIKKASTLAGDRGRINSHIKPLLGRRTVISLTLRDVERFQTDVADGKTAKPKNEKGRGTVPRGGRGAASRATALLGTLLEYARRRGVIKDNPAQGIHKFPDGKRSRFLSFDEIMSLGRVMNEAAAEGENPTGLAAIRALLLTGCRRTEILALPWLWLDIRSRCIRFGDTKTGAQLRPIGAAAVDHLAAQPQRDDSPWVFPANHGDGHFIGAPRVLARLCARADIDGVTLHTLRHSFAATAAELGFSELTIAGLLGHSVPGVTARYAHIPDTALLAAADRVSARIAAALGGNNDAAVMTQTVGTATALATRI